MHKDAARKHPRQAAPETRQGALVALGAKARRRLAQNLPFCRRSTHSFGGAGVSATLRARRALCFANAHVRAAPHCLRPTNSHRHGITAQPCVFPTRIAHVSLRDPIWSEATKTG